MHGMLWCSMVLLLSGSSNAAVLPARCTWQLFWEMECTLWLFNSENKTIFWGTGNSWNSWESQASHLDISDARRSFIALERTVWRYIWHGVICVQTSSSVLLSLLFFLRFWFKINIDGPEQEFLLLVVGEDKFSSKEKISSNYKASQKRSWGLLLRI